MLEKKDWFVKITREEVTESTREDITLGAYDGERLVGFALIVKNRSCDRNLGEKFGFDPKSCIMIGDRPIDAYAGMNAGMHGCLWDADGLFADAKVDFYVEELSEIKNIVDI